MSSTTRSLRPAALAAALILAAAIAAPSAHADEQDANEALTLYADAVAAHGDAPTPEMLDDVVRRLRDALPDDVAKPLVIDRMLTTMDDPAHSAAMVFVLDELGLPRGELLAAAAKRLASDDVLVSEGAAAYLGGYLVRPEIDLDTKLFIIEQLEPVAEHAASLAPSLLVVQLLQHGRNTPSTIKAIDTLLATALPDDAARTEYAVPALVELARTEDGNLRGLAMLKIGEWGIATPGVVTVLLENAVYESENAALARRVKLVAVQTLGDLAPEVAKLGAAVGLQTHRELTFAGASEKDEGVRELIVHVATVLGKAVGQVAGGAVQK